MTQVFTIKRRLWWFCCYEIKNFKTLVETKNWCSSELKGKFYINKNQKLGSTKKKGHQTSHSIYRNTKSIVKWCTTQLYSELNEVRSTWRHSHVTRRQRSVEALIVQPNADLPPALPPTSQARTPCPSQMSPSTACLLPPARIRYSAYSWNFSAVNIVSGGPLFIILPGIVTPKISTVWWIPSLTFLQWIPLYTERLWVGFNLKDYWSWNNILA